MISLTFTAVEIQELFQGGFHLDIHSLAEIFIFSFMFPLTGGYILTILLHIEQDRQVNKRLLQAEHNLVQQLTQVSTWEALTAELIHFITQVAPFVRAILYMPDPFTQNYEPVIVWQPTNQAAFPREPDFTAIQVEAPHQLHQIDRRLLMLPGDETVYCLPLAYHFKPIARLHLYLPATSPLNSQQITTLNNAGPLISSALVVLHPHGHGFMQDAAAESERRRLARHVHDTLAQNLGYLCLQLDLLHLSQQTNTLSPADLTQKLADLHAAANEAYEQVRMTLATLQPTVAINLEENLRHQAEKLADRTHLLLHITQDGEKTTLSPHTSQQISVIFQEALVNIEKHAQAKTIWLNFSWKPDQLIITLQDDGRGFNRQQPTHGHYGLSMMRERTQQIGASFYLDSIPHQGTKMVINVPLVQPL